MRRAVLLALASLSIAACSDLQQPVGIPVEAPGPALSAGAQIQDVIVVFDNDVADPAATARNLVNAAGGYLGHVYETALRGFSASLPPQAIEAIRSNPRVESIEVDGVVRASRPAQCHMGHRPDRLVRRDRRLLHL
ncbi:MAG: protease inhibitor I9 family protein [Gemmatimonadota bacterium]|nr:protease inhibitor I9 family protein [Gemmatimonadota bacterium]